MGPQSKQHVCDSLGYLIEAVAGMDATLQRIERLLARQAETENADLVQVNSRLSVLERRLGGGGNGASTPST